MPSRLIINADDFGQTPGINRAIEELHRAGVLTSATLMAGGAAFDSAVAIAQANHSMGVGCHVVFVDGTPLLPAHRVPSLLGPDGKSFRSSIFDLARAAVRGRLSAEEVELEAEAQIERLQQAGVQVTHVDTHKHTHLFPAVLAPLLRAAGRCGVRSVRRPFEPAWSPAPAGVPLTRRLQLRVLKNFAGAFDCQTSKLATQGLVPHATIGIAATGTLDAHTLRSLLSALPEDGVYELCCHPGHVDATLQAQNTRLRASRETEYQALLEVIPEILRTARAPQLIHYGELGTPDV